MPLLTHRFPNLLRRARTLLAALCFALLIGVLLSAAAPTVYADSTAIQRGPTNGYAVPSGPLNLAVEAPGIIWFTSPEADGIGVLIRTTPPGSAPIQYRVEYIAFQDGSEPYDLVVDNGSVWFTLRGAGQIGRIDIATRAVELYAIPTANSRPTGIDVAPNGQVFFAENTGRLGRFDPADETFKEYVLPSDQVTHPRIEQLRINDIRDIWFTLPDNNAVGNLNSATERFLIVSTGTFAPTGLTLDSDRVPWVTAYGSHRVGRYAPGTVTRWAWYDTPAPDSAPAGIATFDTLKGREVWFAQSNVGSVGRLRTTGFRITHQESISPPVDQPGRLWGVAVDGDDHIWIADTTRQVIYETIVPLQTYFPMIGSE